MPTFRAKGLLFDNDGVLVDSHADGEAAWIELAGEFGLPTEQVVIEMRGVRALDTLGKYLAGGELSAAHHRIEELELASAADTTALAGALALLASLPEGRWAIATSATARLAEARWNGAGIPIPSSVVTAEDVTRGKPDPQPFLIGAERLGLDPTDVIVFEDSPAGGEAGLAAGATVIAVGDQPWQHQPHARVRDLTEVSVAVGDDGLLEVHIGVDEG